MRGSLGARALFVPLDQEQQYAQPVQQQAQGYQPQVDMRDPLAVRRKLTSDYYNNYALLKRIVEDAQKQGIDPFQPDYSQDGGGLAFQAAQEAEANVMYAANLLQNEFQREKMAEEARLRGDARYSEGFDPTSQLISQNPDALYSTKLDPRVAAANQRTGQNVYTQRDASNLNQAVYNPTKSAIQGDPTLSPEEQAYQLGGLFPSVAETSYQQLIPHGGGRGRLGPEDLSQRAELIKQVKRGILTNDQTPLNMLRLVPGVEDVEYVNTGDKVGLQVYPKGNGSPSFIDLSKGGEGEINAFLNRIEGQKNVPNEMVFQFDTKVEIPSSNARQVIDQVKTSVKSFDAPTVDKLQELAASGMLMTSVGEPIASVQIEGPVMGLFGGTDLVITYYPIVNNKVNYNKPKTKKISSAAELDSLVEANSNQIAPAFGGGFVNTAVTDEAARAQELINKYRK